VTILELKLTPPRNLMLHEFGELQTIKQQFCAQANNLAAT